MLSREASALPRTADRRKPSSQRGGVGEGEQGEWVWFLRWFGQAEFQSKSAAKQSRGMLIMGFNEAESWCCPLHQRGFQLKGMQSFALPNEHRNTCLIILSPYWALNNFKQLCCPREKSCGAVEPWGIPSALGPQWGHWGQGQQLWGSLAHPLLLISLLSLWALLTAPPLFSYIHFFLGHWRQHCIVSRFGMGCQQIFPLVWWVPSFLLPGAIFTRGSSKG